jgi:hypothetical protein
VSAVDASVQKSVDVIAKESGKTFAKINEATGNDGRSQRVKHLTSEKEYVAYIGSGEWVIDSTTADDPQMHEYADWLDANAHTLSDADENIV